MENSTAQNKHDHPVRAPRIFEKIPVQLIQINGEKIGRGETSAFSATGSGIRLRMTRGELPEKGETYRVTFLVNKYGFLPFDAEVLVREEAFDKNRFDCFLRCKWSEGTVGEFEKNTIEQFAGDYLQDGDFRKYTACYEILTAFGYVGCIECPIACALQQLNIKRLEEMKKTLPEYLRRQFSKQNVDEWEARIILGRR